MMLPALWQGLQRHLLHPATWFCRPVEASGVSPRTARENRERGKQVERKARLPP